METNKLAAIVGAIVAYMQQEEQVSMTMPKFGTQRERGPWRLFHLQQAMRGRFPWRVAKSRR